MAKLESMDRKEALSNIFSGESQEQQAMDSSPTHHHSSSLSKLAKMSTSSLDLDSHLDTNRQANARRVSTRKRAMSRPLQPPPPPEIF